ncbi:MAG: hypothetical protein WDA59_10950 [Methanofastidiosum sp.]
MIELYKNEKRNIPMKMMRTTKVSFVINSVTCTVTNNSTGVILESGNGTISGPNVYYFLDTTSANYVVNGLYTVTFNVTIAGLAKVIIGQVIVKIK